MTTVARASPMSHLDDRYPLDRDLCQVTDDGGPLDPLSARRAGAERGPPQGKSAGKGASSKRTRPVRPRRPASTDQAESYHKTAFAALVATQDRGMSVCRSREDVARRFDLSLPQVAMIEREGLDRGWPPLDESPGDGR